MMAYKDSGRGTFELDGQIKSLRVSMAIDDAVNSLDFRLALHRFLEDKAPADFESFNRRVYAELFRTPATDPWLGLRSPDIFRALETER